MARSLGLSRMRKLNSASNSHYGHLGPPDHHSPSVVERLLTVLVPGSHACSPWLTGLDLSGRNREAAVDISPRLFTLAGVALGALASYLATALTERARSRPLPAAGKGAGLTPTRTM